MAIEALRGCGYRKVGGLYLCGQGFAMMCDRLPYELNVCPVCGAGVKFTRGFQWISWYDYAGKHENGCKCPIACPVCHPEMFTPFVGPVTGINKKVYGLLWVGEQFYSPESFIQEALNMGVSRRIAAIPKNLELGKTWILFAHIRALGELVNPNGKAEGIPGVFYACRPQSLELLIWEKDATPEKLAELEKKHITPVIIPDGDLDHDPATPLKVTSDERASIETRNTIAAIRRNIGR